MVEKQVPVPPASEPQLSWAGYRSADSDDAVRGNRQWWTNATEWYLNEHGDFLGESDFLWCPEGLRESHAKLLDPVAGKDVLEIGCGAGQCSRYLRSQGARTLGLDLSDGMLDAAKEIGNAAGIHVPYIQADARILPLADNSIDLAFSAFGALPFVREIGAIHREIARVVRPGGQWIFAVSHPIRSAFPDDPGPRGLVSDRSYFDRTPYVELDDRDVVSYAEFHHTLGDHVAAITQAGLAIDNLIEPEWPTDLAQEWGGWSPLRGRHLPGTAIWVTHRP